MYVALCVLLFSLVGCRRDLPVVPVGTSVSGPILDGPRGLYVLNEGNMGSNKCSLDFLDFRCGVYTTNVYQGRTEGLGDVGNDIQIYKGRVYAVINCSNLLEVMDAETASHIGQVEIPNCRYICFKDNYAYVSSYAGPVSLDASHAQIGYVAKIDLRSLEVVDTCHVGYQPNGLAIVGDRLFVANSGGYMVPKYDNRLSEIDLKSFRLIGHREVVANMDKLVADKHDQLWVTTPGDYYNIPSTLICLKADGGQVDMNLAASSLWLQGDSLYVLGNSFDYVTYESHQVAAMIDVRTREVLSRQLITDGTKLVNPYAIAIHPTKGLIYIADARDYVNPGELFCFSPEGKKLWSVRTGDIPGHFVFLY